MSDGAIVFSTALDNSQLEKQLNSLSKKISAIEDKIAQKQAERAPLAEQSAALAAQLDAAKARLEYMKSAQETFSSAAIAQQEETVNALQTKWNAIQTQVERYDAVIKNATIELDRNKERAGAIAAELAAAGSNSNVMTGALNRASVSMDRILTRIRRLAARVMFFSVITMALRSVRRWLSDIVKASPEASAAIAKLKAALLTMVQPLVNVVIPAFTTLVNLLARVVTVIAQFLSMLFGTTLEQSAMSAEALYNEAEALDETGAAAKKASKQLAAFDEINKLGDSSGGSSSNKIKPVFSALVAENTKEQLNAILEIVSAIGAGLLAWKITSMFTKSLSTVAGIAAAAAGAVMLVYNWLDAWNRGITWKNLNGILAGLAAVTVGLAVAFGSLAAGIAFVVGGLALLVVGIKDVIKNGLNLQNVLAIIAGMLATGLGISLITGSWIPMLIAAIASVLLAITYMTGHGGELIAGLKEILGGFIDFFKGVFTRDFTLAAEGINRIFEGVETVFGAVIDGIKDAFLSFLNWLDEKTEGKLSAIIDAVRIAFSGLVDGIKQIFNGLIEFLTGVFTGDWSRAWDGVKQIFKGAWNSIVGLLESAVNLIIKGVNWLISQLNKIHFEVPDWVPVIGGKSYGINIPSIQPVQIPRLATGAVIPPNREFLAVLGDQKSGMNIEAPLETIVEAFRRAGGGEITINLTIPLDGEVIYRNQLKVARRHGQSFVRGEA